MILLSKFLKEVTCARTNRESMLNYVSVITICQSKLNMLSPAEESLVACKYSNQKSEKRET